MLKVMESFVEHTPDEMVQMLLLNQINTHGIMYASFKLNSFDSGVM